MLHLLETIKARGDVLIGQHIGYRARAAHNGYTNFIEQLETETGHAPALLGVNWGRESTAQEIIDSILVLTAWNERGGLITVDFHNVPNPWTGDHTKIIPSGASMRDLIDPGKAVSQVWDAMVARVYGGLLALHGLGIDVFFRPLPEMTYNGAKWWTVGPWLEYVAGRHIEPFKELWRDLHGRFSGLSNLTWVYSTANRDMAVPLDVMYPGTDYVDVVGLSCYGDPPSIAGDGYARLQALGKPIAFCEAGSSVRDGTLPGEAVIDAALQYPDVVLAHFWHSFKTNPSGYGQCAIIDHLRPSETMTHPNVITLDKLVRLHCPDYSEQVEEMREIGRGMIETGERLIEVADSMI